MPEYEVFVTVFTCIRTKSDSALIWENMGAQKTRILVYFMQCPLRIDRNFNSSCASVLTAYMAGPFVDISLCERRISDGLQSSAFIASS